MRIYLTNNESADPSRAFLEAEGTIQELQWPNAYRLALGGQEGRVFFGRIISTDPCVFAINHDAMEKWHGYTLAPTAHGAWRVWRHGMVVAEVDHDRAINVLDALHAIVPE